MLIVCIFSIFCLPYFIRPSAVVISSSSDYGFNNLVSIVSVLVFSVVGILLYAKGISKKDCPQQLVMKDGQINPLGIRPLVYMAAFYSITIVFIFFLTGAFKWYGEAVYFFQRIDRLLLGQVPYIDFEYKYGLLFLYLPLTAYRLLGFTGIGMKAAYYLSFLFLSLLGLIFLSYVIGKTTLKNNHKQVVFYSIAFCAFPLSMGFNYLLIRFITPLAGMIYLDGLIKIGKNSLMKFTGAAIFLLVFNLSISPEIFLAFLISLIIYMMSLSVFSDKRYFISMAGVAGVIAILFISMFKLGYFSSVLSFISCGNNWPVMPSASILIYLFSLFFIAARLSSHYLAERRGHLIISVVVLIVGMMPGALGRCDPGHIFFYGLNLFIISFVVFEKYRRFFYLYAALFIIIFCVGMTVTGIALNQRSCPYYISWNRFLDNNKALLEKTFIEHLERYPQIALPVSNNDEMLYGFLLKSGRYVPDYFVDTSNVYTMSQVDIKLSELKKREYDVIIVNKNDIEKRCIDSNSYISKLFLFPYTHKIVMYSEAFFFTSMNKYIVDNYKMVDEMGIYYIMKRNNAAGQSS
jgi:hypothetical protein